MEAKKGEKGYCYGDNLPKNPSELMVPNTAEVLKF